MKEISFKLSGLHCEGCTSSVKKVLSRISEIKEFDVSMNKVNIVVDGDSNEITNKVTSNVARIGYQAEVI